MNKFKSSKADEVKGIAVRRGNKIRPLMCVTKKHIVKYANKAGLKWFEDNSNNDLRFERNYIRKMVSLLEHRYPKILKNYVIKQNSLYTQKNESKNI